VLVEVIKGGVVKVVCEDIPVANTPTFPIGPEKAKNDSTPPINSSARNGKRRNFTARPFLRVLSLRRTAEAALRSETSLEEED